MDELNGLYHKHEVYKQKILNDEVCLRKPKKDDIKKCKEVSYKINTLETLLLDHMAIDKKYILSDMNKARSTQFYKVNPNKGR